jgi:hypothetical protein
MITTWKLLALALVSGTVVLGAATPAGTAPSGYEIVGPKKIASSPTGVARAEAVWCSSGKVAIGGGISTTGAWQEIVGLGPVTNYWGATVRRTTENPQPDIVLWAICAKFQLGTQLSGGQNRVTVGPHSATPIVATCPEGMVVRSGGVATLDSASAPHQTVRSSYPQHADQWVGVINNDDSKSHRVETGVRCTARPSKYKIVHRDFKRASGTLTVSCPPGLVVSGGGFKAGSAVAHRLAMSKPRDKNTWAAKWKPTSGTYNKGTVYAICTD